MGMVSETVGRRALIAVAIAVGAVFLIAVPPIPQDPQYHQMADQRPLLGVPNALNVLSNLPFAMVGAFGLAATFRRPPQAQALDNPWLRWPLAALFGGTFLTAFGSSYYHLAPDNFRLVWDRLPMTFVCMGLLVVVLAECVSVTAARKLLLPLLALGVGSVVYWDWSERQGRGDLRAYALVQFGSLLAIVLLLAVRRGRFRGTGYLVAGLIAYAGAKVFEFADRPIFALGEIVSGHTLKHLVAATALAFLAAMAHVRTRDAATGRVNLYPSRNG